MNLTVIATLIGEMGVIIGVIIPIIAFIRKLSNGTKCQLRSEMLRIYYKNQETETIRQFDYENFVLLYEAYKALHGNSFIDKIYEEVHSWEIINN